MGMSIENKNVYILVSARGMMLKQRIRHGKASHTWTNNLGRAKLFVNLDEARRYVMDFALRYPYDEYDSKILDDAFFRKVSMTPLHDREEVFSDKYIPKSMTAVDGEDEAVEG